MWFGPTLVVWTPHYLTAITDILWIERYGMRVNNDKLDSSDCWLIHLFDGLVQDCSNFIANTLEFLQYCIKPSIYDMLHLTSRTPTTQTCQHHHNWNVAQQPIIDRWCLEYIIRPYNMKRKCLVMILLLCCFSLKGIHPIKNILRMISKGVWYLMKTPHIVKLNWHTIIAPGGGNDCDYSIKSIELLQMCCHLNQSTKKIV